MAHAGYDFDGVHRTQHDGALRCLLCNETGRVDLEWCFAAESLVCPDCCNSLLSGDARIVAALTANTSIPCPEALFSACSRCSRGSLFFSDQAFEESPSDSGPC